MFNKSYLLIIAAFLFFGMAVEGVPAPNAVVGSELNLKRGDEVTTGGGKQELVADLYGVDR